MSGRKTTIGYRLDDPRGRHGFRVRFPETQEDTPPVEGEEYAGPYIVRPTPAGQTLDTDGKVMKDDVTVEPIPYFAVSNEAGGKTVYIGE